MSKDEFQSGLTKAGIKLSYKRVQELLEQVGSGYSVWGIWFRVSGSGYRVPTHSGAARKFYWSLNTDCSHLILIILIVVIYRTCCSHMLLIIITFYSSSPVIPIVLT